MAIGNNRSNKLSKDIESGLQMERTGVILHREKQELLEDLNKGLILRVE